MFHAIQYCILDSDGRNVLYLQLTSPVIQISAYSVMVGFARMDKSILKKGILEFGLMVISPSKLYHSFKHLCRKEKKSLFGNT